VLVLVLAACGSSKHASSTTTTSLPPPPGHTAPVTQPYTLTATTGKTSTAGASGARLPATFTIRSGEDLTPTIIGGPAGVTVDVTLISGDRMAHSATVAGRALMVPAGGRASAALGGLSKGNYPVLVDGAKRGTLVIGAQPGP